MLDSLTELQVLLGIVFWLGLAVLLQPLRQGIAKRGAPSHRKKAKYPEGLGLRATARVFAVEAKTLLGWLVEVFEHSAEVCTYLLQNAPVSQIQLDELFALVAEWRGQEPSEAEAAQALERLPRRPRWVWTAIDPVSKLFIHRFVGERTLAMAQAVIHYVIQCLAKGSVPLFLSDGLSYYRIALLTHFGHCWQPPRRSEKGAAPKPRWCPLPSLNYAEKVPSSAFGSADSAGGLWLPRDDQKRS